MAIFFIYISPFLVPQPGQAGTKKYLSPRHKDTKDFILLFFLSVLVPGGEKKKFLPQDLRALNLDLFTLPSDFDFLRDCQKKIFLYQII